MLNTSIVERESPENRTMLCDFVPGVSCDRPIVLPDPAPGVQSLWTMPLRLRDTLTLMNSTLRLSASLRPVVSNTVWRLDPVAAENMNTRWIDRVEDELLCCFLQHFISQIVLNLFKDVLLIDFQGHFIILIERRTQGL